MKIPAPHFLLFSESNPQRHRGDWRFVLQSVDGSEKIEAADVEPHIHGERLELLAVVRGLEALDRPSRVTLVTPSKYVSRGFNYGLEEWRANDWQWESFGEMVPVKNQDLWRRIDHALGFHEVQCRTWRFDGGQDDFQMPDNPLEIRAEPLRGREKPDSVPTSACGASRSATPSSRIAMPILAISWPAVRRRLKRLLAANLRRGREGLETFRLLVAQCGSGCLTQPWFD